MIRKRKPKIATFVKSKKGDPFIKIVFPFDHKDLKNVKSLPDRQFINGDTPYWVVPLSIGSVKRLSDWGFKVHPILFDMCHKMKIERLSRLKSITKIKGFTGVLFDYQKIGVGFIDSHNGRALIADEMGLGKTIQAIAWMCLHPEAVKALIIVPTSLKYKWERECLKFMQNPNVQILSGKKPYDITGDILIINYEILNDWKKALVLSGIQLIVIDEIHYFKNSKAIRTKAVKFISKKIPYIIGLSGTPIENRPVEIYNVCNLINPTALPNWFMFTERFCAAKITAFGRDVTGSSNTRELYELLTNTIMIRRKKSEVLKDLPPIIYTDVPIEITNRKEYDEAENNFINYMKGNISKAIEELDAKLLELASSEIGSEFDSILGTDKKELLKLDKIDKVQSAEILVQLGVLKQLAVAGKMKGIVDWITDFLNSGEKLIVFCMHKETINVLTKTFPKSVKIDGSVTKVKRQNAIDAFQTDKKIKICFINFAAGAEGLDLVAASNVAVIEYPWTPSKVDQAFARAHRIGQEKQVTGWFLNGINTIDVRLSTLIDEKRKIIDGILEGVVVKPNSLIKDLIKTYET